VQQHLGLVYGFRMPDETITTQQVDPEGYGRFVESPTRTELERYFFLDDADRELIAKRRADHNRLGFALQMVTVRYLGTFLADPLDVPTNVVDYLAGQLGVVDPSCAKAYLERRMTRFEHQREIAETDGWRDFAEVEGMLAQWVDDRAWTTGDGPGTLFAASVGWLRERKVLLGRSFGSVSCGARLPWVTSDPHSSRLVRNSDVKIGDSGFGHLAPIAPESSGCHERRPGRVRTTSC
jgi:hypothetical protein